MRPPIAQIGGSHWWARGRLVRYSVGMTRTGLRLSLLLLALTLTVGPMRGHAAEAEADFPGQSSALEDALTLADRHEGAAVFRVSGTSMLPFFGEGALLVMKPIPPARLRPGMVVVYRNRLGETVAHRLINESREGWVVRGYNNDRADSTRVDEKNLRGVVYAILHPRSLEPDQDSDRAREALAAVPIALAAPAR